MGAILKVKDQDGNIIPIRAIKGPKGDTGATGATGPKGDTGATGPKGDTGKSAYEIAVENGATEKTEAEWLATLKPYNVKYPFVTVADSSSDGTGTLNSSLISGGVYLVYFKETGGFAQTIASGVLYCDTSKAKNYVSLGPYQLEITTSDWSIQLTASGNNGKVGILYFYKLGSLI